MEDKIQWHPAFYGAAELEFRENKKDLTFEREYNLSKEPIRVDLLIIKKVTDAIIRNEIGQIFRDYNIVEYKSPEDGLTIDDYFKTVGYACLYKGLGQKVNQIPAEQLTVSLVRDTYPVEMIKELERMGLDISEAYSGIYYVNGNIQFPTQIILTSRLTSKTHSWLKVLTKKLNREDAVQFIEAARELTESGDRNNADAIFEVSATANQALYEEMRRDPYMCNALREIMKEELEEEKEIGKEIGKEMGRRTQLIENVEALMRKLNICVEEACNMLDVSMEQYLEAKK